MARRLSNYLVVFALAAAAAAKCEVLRSLEFQQHTAPKGVSELLGPVMSLVSEKADSVGDIRIRWDGELGLHRVGTHKIIAESTRRGKAGAPRAMKPLSSYHGDRGVERADGQRRHGARKPDAAAAGAQGRLLPVPRAGASREGGVPVALRLADDLRLKLSPDAFAAYLRLLAHASRRTPPPRRDQL